MEENKEKNDFFSTVIRIKLDRCECGHSELVHAGSCHVQGCQCRKFVLREGRDE